jgi:hypothetical protein
MRQLLILPALWLLGLAPDVSAQTYDAPTLVDSWYRTYLGRPSYVDGGGTGWVNLLLQGNTPQSVLSSILGGEEYLARSGGTMAGYIQSLYSQVLGRPPTPAEQEFWLRQSYTQDRKTIAYEILTQNPSSGIIVTPPRTVVFVPALHQAWLRAHEREWARERERHHVEHEIHERKEHDYRRPYYPYRK